MTPTFAAETEITQELPAFAAPQRAPSFSLSLVYSGGAVVAPPRTFELPPGATPIGRQVARGVCLPGDPRASRLHATLHHDGLGALRVVDEGSRNGTRVNGVPREEAPLHDGDLLTLGDSLLVVRALPPHARDAAVPGLLGVSPAIAASRATLVEAGPTSATVLLLAQSGCGKEVAARALHELSGRGGPFVAVNCSAIPETLAESQLFGQVAGAFTGAVARLGLFRAAHGGTLFLDEIGDLPLALQPKLLRVLEERAVLPVGATAAVPVDVRIVAATHRDLPRAVAADRFRGDLYARLAQLEVQLPPLRARREDVLLLVGNALGRALGDGLGNAPGDAQLLSPALAEALILHPWPFNVRELLAVAQQLRIRAAAEPAAVGRARFDLPLVADRLGHAAAFAAEGTDESAAPSPLLAAPPAPAGPRGERDEIPDRDGVEEILRAHRGVIADIARVAGRSRKQVYRWIANHGLDLARYRS